MMRNYSVNKIHALTGISATTIKKYLPVLIENGWVKFDGKQQQHLIVSRLASDAKNRNICIDKFCYDSYKDVYRSLRAFLALIIQSHKDFIKRTIQIATNPKRGQNFKAARKLVKRLVRQGILKSVYDAYREFGLSLKRIAKETGNCVRTAQNIMNYAVSKKWCAKQHHYEKVKSANYFSTNFMFYKNGNLYNVFANTYELSAEVSLALTSHGNNR